MIRKSQGERDLVCLTTHSDRGAAMMAKKTQQLLQDAGVKRRYSRPSVSDDNVFIESFFKTLKHGPTFPGHFLSKTETERWLHQFVSKYHSYPHSGLRGDTPEQAYTGRWYEAWLRRQKTWATDYDLHSERFRQPPKAATLPNAVTINVRQPKRDEIAKRECPWVHAPMAALPV